MARHKDDHGNADEGGHSRRAVVVAEISAVPFCLGDKQKTDVAMTSSHRLLCCRFTRDLQAAKAAC